MGEPNEFIEMFKEAGFVLFTGSKLASLLLSFSRAKDYPS